MKKQILDHCRQLIEDKLTALKKNLADLQESANEDSKSAMGDKYETGRAMVQLEQENLLARFEDLNVQKSLLQKITVTNSSQVIRGSLVSTNLGVFIICVGLGKIEVNGNSYFAVDANSPIGAKMLGLTAGNTFQLNGRSYEILEVV